MLNSILGRAEFRAGFCVGRGMTTVLQKVLHNNIWYADTPGLADIERKEQAAAEIKQILLQARRLTLIFVVTLEAGRVRPSDVITIQVILKSMVNTVTKNRFGIVINKVSANAERHMTQENGTVILRAFQAESENFQTSFIYFNRKDAALEDVDDVVAAPNPGLELFIASITPVELEPENVRDIDIADYAAQVAGLGLELARLQEATAAQIAEYDAQMSELRLHAEQELAAQMERTRVAQVAMAAELEKIKDDFEKQALDAKRENEHLHAEHVRDAEARQRELAHSMHLLETQAAARESIAEAHAKAAREQAVLVNQMHKLQLDNQVIIAQLKDDAQAGKLNALQELRAAENEARRKQDELQSQINSSRKESGGGGMCVVA